ncbi:MAG: aminopeptidase P family protein [Ktedonobacteraceae bacterium]|nr:aminopeptidase P family protein [Ktedonobacteraceae bacterium]
MQLERMQEALRAAKLDGWLFYDFRKSNPVAYQVLGLSLEEFYSRRWCYFVPSQGAPTAIISAVESHKLMELPGERLVFRTWQELHTHLNTCVKPGMRVAMEYSPLNAIPYMARVDAGTVELVRSFGAEVVSSADLAQRFLAQLNQQQIDGHREAGRRLIAAKDQLFAELGSDLRAGREPNEYQLAQRFAELIRDAGLVLANAPHVAINANASNPHYEPTASHHSPVRRGDLVLVDFFAHLPQQNAIFADYTWMAFAGTEDEIPQHQRDVFAIVRQARDSAIAFVRERLASGAQVEGRQVDDVARGVISQAGYGDYFVHRTGHNIGAQVHGDGANVDNFETQDNRVLLPFTCCSIEPGIYLPEFGIRSEVDLLILEHDAEVTGVPIQERIVPLL